MGNHKQVDGGFSNPPSIVLLLPFWSDDRRGETCLEWVNDPDRSGLSCWPWFSQLRCCLACT